MRLLITAALLSAFANPALARHHHRHYQNNAHVSHHESAAQPERRARGGGIVTVKTAAGPITVAAHLADRFNALIDDFIAHGYKPRSIGCHAHGGHVPNSRHYAGAACDFDQSGLGRTTSFMYHARAIIKKHGFRDGCAFGDCGHVDDGKTVHYARSRWDSFFGG